MKKNNFFVFLVVVFFLLTNFSLVHSDEYKIATYDKLLIRVLENKDYNVEVTVSSDGTVDLPLIQKVKAKGLTIPQLAEKIKKELEKEYFYKATVLVKIEEDKGGSVYVFGQVNHSGVTIQLPKDKELRVTQLISMAGGFTKKADPNRVTVLRKEKGEEKRKKIEIKINNMFEEMDFDEDIYLKPGDFVYVPGTETSNQIYVVGQVKKPGPMSLPADEVLTVGKVIILAGGFSSFAKRKAVKLVRPSKDGKSEEIFKLNMDEILVKGKLNKDIPVKAGDMIIVPESFFNF